MERGPRGRRVRDREHREVPVRKGQPLRLGVDDVDPERQEEPQDADGFRRAWRVVVPRDDDDDRVRQFANEPRELREREEDGRIWRPDVVKDIAGDDDEIRLEVDDLVDGGAKHRPHVRLSLVDAGGGLALELAVAEMKIREMNKPHRWP